jgi:hypothetical protein
MQINWPKRGNKVSMVKVHEIGNFKWQGISCNKPLKILLIIKYS